MTEKITPGMSSWNFRPLKTRLVFIATAPDFLSFALEFRQRVPMTSMGQEDAQDVKNEHITKQNAIPFLKSLPALYLSCGS